MIRTALALLLVSTTVFAQSPGWKQVSYEREGQVLRIKHPDGRVEEFELCGGADPGPDPDAGKISAECKKPEGKVVPSSACVTLTARCSSDNATMIVFQARALGAKEWTTRAQQCASGSLTVDGLKANTEYEVRARTLCKDGSVSAWTKISDVKTKPPATPALTLEEAKPTSLVLGVRADKSCPAPEGQRYEVSYATGDGPAKTLSNQIVPFAIHGLERGTIYRVRLRVKDGVVESEWSSERELSTAK